MKTETTVSGCAEVDGCTIRCTDAEAEFYSVYTSKDGEAQMWHSDHETRAAAEFEATKLAE